MLRTLECDVRTELRYFPLKSPCNEVQKYCIQNISFIHPGLPRQITVKWLVSEITLHGISPRQKFCKVHIRMRVNLVS